MKLIIGNKNYSSWSLRAWLFLAANHIEFEEVRIPLDTPSTQQQLSQYTDAAKVPVLHDGELVVWDSLAICEYVSEKYLAQRGWPDAIEQRAIARAAVAEMHSSFTSLRNFMPMNCRARNRQVEMTAELTNDISRMDQLWSSLRKRFGEQGPWLAGSFGIIDCMFAPVVFRFLTYGVEVSQPSEDYKNTLLAHPEMQRWLAEAEAEQEILQREETGVQL